MEEGGQYLKISSPYLICFGSNGVLKIFDKKDDLPYELIVCRTAPSVKCWLDKNIDVLQDISASAGSYKVPGQVSLPTIVCNTMNNVLNMYVSLNHEMSFPVSTLEFE